MDDTCAATAAPSRRPRTRPMDAAPPLWASLSKLLGPDKDVANHPWAGVRVLLRLDLNLPLSSDGAVTDRSRLDAALPGLELLLGKGARVAVATHFGRPQPGAESHAEMEARDGLAPVAGLLRAALGAAFVGAASDVAGPSAAALVASLANGQACLLQNVRFEAGETAAEGSPAFAALSQRLAALCDAFVLDGFGVCHRAQASVTGVARLVPLRLPGPLVRRELAAFAACLSAPARPFVVLLGGAKVADKLGVVSALLRVADVVLVGGKSAPVRDGAGQGRAGRRRRRRWRAGLAAGARGWAAGRRLPSHPRPWAAAP